MVYLTRKCEFSASHYYHNPEFSAEENQRIFGKCANLNGHGHNYTLEVTVKGEVDPTTGFVVDLKELKEILNREVLEALDHRHLEQGSAGVPRADSYDREPCHCHLESPARASCMLQNCIECGCTSCPISLSISMGKHEGLSDSAVPVFGIAPFALRRAFRG